MATPLPIALPITVGSSVRARITDAAVPADAAGTGVVLILTAASITAPWLSAASGRGYPADALELLEVLHDEGYAALLANLPTWAELSDADKGAALMFLHKVDVEGYDYASENYAVCFVEHPVLTALTEDDACAYVRDWDFGLWRDGWCDDSGALVVANADVPAFYDAYHAARRNTR